MTDFVDMHGDALHQLACVLLSADRIPDASAAAGEALRLHEQKGNLVSATRTQAFIEALAPIEAPSVDRASA